MHRHVHLWTRASAPVPDGKCRVGGCRSNERSNHCPIHFRKEAPADAHLQDAARLLALGILMRQQLQGGEWGQWCEQDMEGLAGTVQVGKTGPDLVGRQARRQQCPCEWQACAGT